MSEIIELDHLEFIKSDDLNRPFTLAPGYIEQYIEYHDIYKKQIKIICYYHNNKKINLYQEFYPNGNLKYECNFSDDKLEGIFRKYHENGKCHIERNYKNGLLHGEFKIYDFNSELIYQ